MSNRAHASNRQIKLITFSLSPLYMLFGNSKFIKINFTIRQVGGGVRNEVGFTNIANKY